MSRETLQHLNANTLIGNTDARGTAWHYRAEHQGEETNHYPGPIPIEHVQRRLFAWHAETRRLAVEVPSGPESMTHLSENRQPTRWAVLADRQAICRSDDTHGTAMGIFSPGYAMHQYQEWLLTTVANILDDTLTISSAGLLRGGAIAWVEVSVPDSITTAEGVTFRPNLLATTSFDGSIATTFKRTVTDTVCDNTRECALAESGQQYKVKHSRHSHTTATPQVSPSPWRACPSPSENSAPGTLTPRKHVVPTRISGVSKLPPWAAGVSAESTSRLAGATPTVPCIGSIGRSTVKSLSRALNRAVRAVRESSQIQTSSGSGGCSVGVRCVEVRAPNSGTVVEAAQSRLRSIDTKCTARVSPVAVHPQPGTGMKVLDLASVFHEAA